MKKTILYVLLFGFLAVLVTQDALSHPYNKNSKSLTQIEGDR